MLIADAETIQTTPTIWMPFVGRDKERFSKVRGKSAPILNLHNAADFSNVLPP